MRIFQRISARTLRNVAFAIMLAAVSPYLFVQLQTLNPPIFTAIIQTFEISTKTWFFVVMSSLNITGALIAAGVIGIPLGWFVKERATQYGVFVGFVASATLIYWAYSWTPPPIPNMPPPIQWSSFVIGIFVIEYVAFILGCMYFSSLGARFGRKTSA